MSSSIYIAVPVMLLLSVVQTAVLPHFAIFGIVPQLPFLVALAWGLLRGVTEGVVWGFIAGICLDLFSLNLFGMTPLAYMPAIFIVIWLQQGLPINRFFSPMLLAAGATLIMLFLYLLMLRISGHTLTVQAFVVLPRMALLHAITMLPVYWLMHMIYYTLRPRRVQL